MRKALSIDQKDKLFGFALAMPAILILCIAVFMPILKGIYVSFCRYKLADLNTPAFNNFANYIKLFKKGDIWQYFGNTILYVFLAVMTQFILGFAVALFLNGNIKGRKLFRGLFLIPWTIPSIVVAMLWRWMLHQQFGVLNYLFYNFGLTSTVNLSWTMNPTLAMISVAIAAAWRQLPYMMVMLLAGLQSVDETLVEASRIDGANAWRTLLHVKLPVLRPVLISAVWIAVMTNFQMYTIISNMTGGGPVNATTTLSLAAYKAAFQSYNFGEGAAIGVLWLLLLFVITLISNKLNDRFSVDYQ